MRLQDCKIAKLQNCKIVEKPLLKCISGSLIAVTLMAKRASWDLFQKLSSNKSKSDESNPLLQHSNQLRCHSFTDNQCNPTQFENWIIHALLVVIFAAKNVISYVFFAWYWWYVNCSEAWFRFAWFGTTVATQDHCLNQPWKLMPELARSSKIELTLIFQLNSFESHHPFDKWDSDQFHMDWNAL